MRGQSFPGTLDSLAPIRALVLQEAAAAGLEEQARYRLCLAVDEIVTNTIIHGYTEAGRTGTVELEVWQAKGSLIVELEDTGAPCNLMERQLPTPEELERPLEERPVGGLGLFLVMQSVDVFFHENLGLKNRTLLIMQGGRETIGGGET